MVVCPMITHEQIWIAIDQLARMRGYSTSGLARRAGLDPTAFNPSKRVGQDGKLRWPSTESLARILDVTEFELFEFAQVIIATNREVPNPGAPNPLPPTSFSPPSPPIRETPPPMITIETDLYAPIYRAGDRLILSSSAPLTLKCRVAVCPHAAGLVIGELKAMDEDNFEILPLSLIAHPPGAPLTPSTSHAPSYTPLHIPQGPSENPKNYNLILNKSLVKWVGRVMWASQ